MERGDMERGEREEGRKRMRYLWEELRLSLWDENRLTHLQLL